MRMLQKTITEGVACGGVRIAQYTRNEPDHCIDHHHGPQLTTGEDEIADGDLGIDMPVDKAFIHAFVATAYQNESIRGRQRLGQGLIESLSLGREQQRRCRCHLFFGFRQGRCQRFRFHHHSAAAAVWPVIRDPMSPFGMVADVDGDGVDFLPLNRATDNTVIPKRTEQFREKGQHANVHGSISHPIALPVDQQSWSCLPHQPSRLRRRWRESAFPLAAHPVCP